MSRINAPCKGCIDRSTACHTYCEKYLDFKEASKARKREKDAFLEYARARKGKRKQRG